MNELTIIIDDWGHKELKEYLTSLKGILEVIIKNERQLGIYIKYDSTLINDKIIKREVLLFLDIYKMPSIISFDKHPTIRTLEYKIIKNSICCEYCFKNAVDTLFEIEGIEKVESNFTEEYLLKKGNECENIVISIKYNPDLINPLQMKQIALNLNI